MQYYEKKLKMGVHTLVTNNIRGEKRYVRTFKICQY